jgi:hypothetical protein
MCMLCYTVFHVGARQFGTGCACAGRCDDCGRDRRLCGADPGYTCCDAHCSVSCADLDSTDKHSGVHRSVSYRYSFAISHTAAPDRDSCSCASGSNRFAWGTVHTVHPLTDSHTGTGGDVHSHSYCAAQGYPNTYTAAHRYFCAHTHADIHPIRHPHQDADLHAILSQ